MNRMGVGKMTDTRADAPPKPISDENLRRILELLETVKYGTITLVLQDGVLVQIEHSEKERLR